MPFSVCSPLEWMEIRMHRGINCTVTTKKKSKRASNINKAVWYIILSFIRTGMVLWHHSSVLPYGYLQETDQKAL